MFTYRSSYVKRFLNVSSNYAVKRNSQQVVKSKIQNIRANYFSPHLPKEPQRKPFLKDLLFMKFDDEIFSFPRTQSSNRYRDFFNWLKPIEYYISSCAGSDKVSKQEILANLRDLEVFRAHLNEEDFGLNLSETESLRLIETLSNIPWLGTFIVKNHILPVQLISKYGSDNQKSEYFLRITNGEVIPTICIKEDDNNPNINNIKSYVVPHEGDNFLLNGEKSYVVNGTDANVFLVFAIDLTTHNSLETVYSLLLVEKDMPGVTVTKAYETAGQCEIPLCTVKFNDVVLSKKNIIGEPGDAFKIMMDLLKPGKQNVSTQAICILRNFVNNLVRDVIHTKYFDRNLHDFEFVKKLLGEIVYTLYTMESMAYLTSGLADFYENQDVEIERIITEQYCANQCVTCIQKGLQLMGTQSYLKNNSYLKAFHDALALTTLDTNNLDASVYVASHVFKHVGNSVHEHVFKVRNPFVFPWYNLKETWFNFWEPDLKIKNNIHPSLYQGARYLEECIPKLHLCIIKSLTRYGAEITNRQMEHCRIMELLTEVYGLTANLSRVTRSYSIGLRNSDHERLMVQFLAHGTQARVFQLSQDIEEGEILNGDYVHKTTIDITYNHHQYPLEHPLDRTF